MARTHFKTSPDGRNIAKKIDRNMYFAMESQTSTGLQIATDGEYFTIAGEERGAGAVLLSRQLVKELCEIYEYCETIPNLTRYRLIGGSDGDND